MRDGTPRAGDFAGVLYNGLPRVGLVRAVVDGDRYEVALLLNGTPADGTVFVSVSVYTLPDLMWWETPNHAAAVMALVDSVVADANKIRASRQRITEAQSRLQYHEGVVAERSAHMASVITALRSLSGVESLDSLLVEVIDD